MSTQKTTKQKIDGVVVAYSEKINNLEERFKAAIKAQRELEDAQKIAELMKKLEK